MEGRVKLDSRNEMWNEDRIFVPPSCAKIVWMITNGKASINSTK
jgi:hypothetical protein